jgi:adenosylcobinamide-GDP ribazoletransferase
MQVVDLVRRELRGAAAAIAFLTRLPVGRVVPVDGSDLARGVVVFPVVGAAIGAACAGFGVLLAQGLSHAVAGSLALAASLVLTGALHADALADTADALGGRSAEEALTIMRDPRVGSYGVAALTVALIIEASALASLVAERRIAEVATAFALSRAVAPSIAAALPYARPGTGLARSLAGSRSRACVAIAVTALVATALRPNGAWTLVGSTLACAFVATLLFRARFGGMTGDTLGSAIVLTEVACLVAASSR